MKKYYYAILSLVRFICINLFVTRKFKFTHKNLIFPLCNFDFSTKSQVNFRYNVSMRRNTQIIVRNSGYLYIGNNCFFNSNCIITCHKYIKIGDNCKFGPGCMMFDQDHNMQNSKTITEKNNFTSDTIVIGEGCWFGAGCIILKGTQIGDKCVFGAGSIIKGNYLDNSIVIQKRNSVIRKFV